MPPPTDDLVDGLAESAPRELRARGRRTMRKLLDAGARVFAERGYHAARVDDIVKRARTSHGTFYLYFANKEELFRALAGEVGDAMQDLAESLGPIGPDGAGRAELVDWIDRFCTAYTEAGPVIRAWTEAEISDSEFGRLGDDVLAGFTAAITERLRDSAPPGLDPSLAALIVVAMLERLNYYTLTGGVDIPHDRKVATLADAVQRALYAR